MYNFIHMSQCCGKMSLIINFAAATASAVYSMYVYTSLNNDMINVWHLMFYPSLQLTVQLCVVHVSLNTTFPSVIYDTSSYPTPRSITVLIYVLYAVSIMLILYGLFASILFVEAIDTLIAIATYQLIQIIIIICTSISFFTDSLPYCTGWAYSRYLETHNYPDTKYAILPFTLPEHEMEIYLGEKFLSRRAHTV